MLKNGNVCKMYVKIVVPKQLPLLLPLRLGIHTMYTKYNYVERVYCYILVINHIYILLDYFFK